MQNLNLLLACEEAMFRLNDLEFLTKEFKEAGWSQAFADFMEMLATVVKELRPQFKKHIAPIVEQEQLPVVSRLYEYPNVSARDLMLSLDLDLMQNNMALFVCDEAMKVLNDFESLYDDFDHADHSRAVAQYMKYLAEKVDELRPQFKKHITQIFDAENIEVPAGFFDYVRPTAFWGNLEDLERMILEKNKKNDLEDSASS